MLGRYILHLLCLLVVIVTMHSMIRTCAFHSLIVEDDPFLSRQPQLRGSRRKRVIVAFPFNHEIDILRIRIREQRDVVDKFVIVESNASQRGFPKPRVYWNHRFEFANENIDHHTLHFKTNEHGDTLSWKFESEIKHQALERACQGEPSSTILIASDADEIVSAEAIKYLHGHTIHNHTVYTLASTMRVSIYGFFWTMGKSYKYSTAEIMTCGTFRLPHNLRRHNHNFPIDPSGWHCTYCIPVIQYYEKMHNMVTTDGSLLLSNCSWSLEDLFYFRQIGMPLNGRESQTYQNVSECALNGKKCAPKSVLDAAFLYLTENTHIKLKGPRFQEWRKSGVCKGVTLIHS